MALQENIISPELLKEISHFESFLFRIGFKRVDGAIYGLLVLSSNALTSEEIEKTLSLSQSAISQSLKTLIHYGAVQTKYLTSKRANVHSANPNALQIVSSIFKKREQEKIQEFKEMAKRAIQIKKNQTTKLDSIVLKRLENIVSTCELAEVVISFVIKLSSTAVSQKLNPVINRLPHLFDLLSGSADNPITPLAGQLSNFLKNTKLARNKTNLDNTKGL